MVEFGISVALHVSMDSRHDSPAILDKGVFPGDEFRHDERNRSSPHHHIEEESPMKIANRTNTLIALGGG